MMRSMIGGDGVDGAVDQAGDQSVSIGARSERRIHFVMGVVANVFVGERKMVRGNLTGDLQAIFLGEANVLESAGGGQVREVQARVSQAGEFDITSGADRFGLRRNSL